MPKVHEGGHISLTHLTKIQNLVFNLGRSIFFEGLTCKSSRCLKTLLALSLKVKAIPFEKMPASLNGSCPLRLFLFPSLHRLWYLWRRLIIISSSTCMHNLDISLLKYILLWLLLLLPPMIWAPIQLHHG